MEGSEKLQSSNYSGAISDYTKAIELDSTMIEAFVLRGTCKNVLGDYRGSIPDFEQAIIFFNLFVDTSLEKPYKKELLANSYNGRGIAKSGLSDYKGAIKDITKAIEINDKKASYYLARGFARIGNKQKKLGCLDFSKAGELGDSEAYNSIKDLCN